MFKLEPLPYAYDALEPYIDTKTMELHHDKHHQKYIDELNSVLEKYPQYKNKSLIELLQIWPDMEEDIREKVRNNAGGHYNHQFFWPSMTNKPAVLRNSKIGKLIESRFGGFDAFQQQFNTAAKEVFGSGWAWLVLDHTGNAEIMATQNQDCPVMIDAKPLLGLDVWEHAYYLKYNNKRVDYISAWWNVINWDFVEQQLK